MNQRLLVLYGAWAKKNGLEEHRHDARFKGRIKGVELDLETGIRDSGRYPVVIELEMVTELSSHDLEAVADELGVRIRVDPMRVTVRLRPDSPPEEVGPVVEAVIDAVREKSARAYR